MKKVALCILFMVTATGTYSQSVSLSGNVYLQNRGDHSNISILFRKKGIGLNTNFYTSITIGTRSYQQAITLNNSLPFGITVSRVEIYNHQNSLIAQTSDPGLLNNYWIGPDSSIGLSLSPSIPPTLDEVSKWYALWYCNQDAYHFTVRADYGSSSSSTRQDSVTTDVSGYFFKQLDSGVYDIIFSKSSYHSDSVVNHLVYSSRVLPSMTLKIVVAPSVPALTSPINGTSGALVSPTLTWSAVTGATTYRLQVSTSSTFVTTVFDDSALTSTSSSISGLSNSTTYYWRVNAKNAGGTSGWSSTWSFTTIIAAPSLASPPNGATGISVSLTLAWSAVSGAATYHLQISNISSFSTTVVNQSGITSTSYSASGLANNTLYYWRVNVTNAGGTSSYSSTWNFTTIVAAPSAPILLSPANGSINQQVNTTLTWNSATGGDSYRLQHSTNTNFSPTFVDDSTLRTTSRLVGPLALNTLYYWRVSAKNLGGVSPWSNIFSFSTIRTTMVETIGNDIPKDYNLSQNYPNPFNPVTTIELSIPKQSPVVLTIFNSLGMEIEVLLNEHLPPGHYRTQWTPRDFPSGVYFCQLRSSEFHDTKKLLLLR